MVWAAVAVGVGTAAAGAYGASQSASAAGAGADAQNLMALYGGMVQQQNLQNVQGLLAPWTNSGIDAVANQRNLAGLNGPAAQQQATDAISASPQFNAIVDQGENAMRQNASATGGLRGGNFQGALAQFRPSMLASAINDQYNRLGGLSNIGQNSALSVGNLNTGAANNQTSLLAQIGANNAGAALAGGRAQAQGINSVVGGLSTALPAILGGNTQGAWNPSYGSNPGAGTAYGGGGLQLNNNFGGATGPSFGAGLVGF